MPAVPVSSDVGLAADRLRRGGLVGMPTETVYGLGALARLPEAVDRIFRVKERPRSHPLIVHLGGADHLDTWGSRIPGYARRLAEVLWPGPMTLVVPATAEVPARVTGGAPTVALRVPDHPVALDLLALLGDGVAAPSANLFGHVSPTRAHDVVEELGDRLDPATDLVLDGGPSRVGVESTIIDCTSAAPRILRPGAVTPADIAAVGGVEPSGGTSSTPAPGTLPSHYAPRTRVIPMTWEEAQAYCAPDPRVRARGRVVPQDGDGLLAPAELVTPPSVVRLASFADNDDYARRLYQGFRSADRLSLTRVVVVEAESTGVGPAVNDRVTRAAHGSSPLVLRGCSTTQGP